MKKFYFLLFTFCLFTGVNAQIINFPDANFKTYLLQQGIDTNSDGEIDQSEAQNYSQAIFVNNLNIINLSGIEYFTNIFGLECSNNQITNLDVSTLGEIRFLRCNNNQLTSLNVSNLNFLNEIDCKNNSLTNFTISNLPGLHYVECENNQLSTLVIDNFPNLAGLTFNNNQLTSISVSNCPELYYLYCRNNFITNISLSNLPDLDELNLAENQLMTINISNLTNLSILHCYSNPPLSTLFIKNGKNQDYIVLYGVPNLEYICADESEISTINISMLPGCNINSYCSFVPGGAFYTVSGNAKFDLDNNGCNASDIDYPRLRFSVASGSTAGSLISNDLGNYSIPVQSGSHTITPVLENPTYFTISPSTVNVTFPTQASPFVQNFCVTANGVHPDLEITLLPTTPARPGFDANYSLIYKNKGTNTQSGTVSLAFDDTRLDFVSSVPTTNTQTAGNLTWDFANLQPFETREIAFSLNINSPMETSAVNGGDQLDFSAVISPIAGDEIPYDNTFGLKQTVVNSFDPNDKTCLEGATIAPSEVGKYVHYMIRFENTGTFPAENIVVKDMIDTAKFDINTLVPIKGSHPFVTNITAGNKVEFIFENINLPFDDANNDGYVAFKIKTKPTLVNGDTFSNSANIYFDYNFPIVTNTATTTIQALNTQDFAFGSYFSLYPNPVNNVLNIEIKQAIEVSSISIYNQLGQLVLVVPSAQNVSKVDVSSLSSGNYFIKINSDKGTSNTKFIKL